MPPRLSALEERFADRLTGNEALIGNLTVAEYEPLLNRALQRLHAAARLTAGMPDARAEQVMEAAYAHVLRELRRHVAIESEPTR